MDKKICIEFTKNELDHLRQYMEILAFDYFPEMIKKQKGNIAKKGYSEEAKRAQNLEKVFSIALNFKS